MQTPTTTSGSSAVRSRLFPARSSSVTHSHAQSAEPTDRVQMATPEQAAQAALHPILEPAVQFALLTGFMLAAGNAQGSAIPLVTVDAALTAMGKGQSMTYTIDLKNDDTPVSTGTYGEPVTDKLTAPSSGPMVYEGVNGTRLQVSEDKTTKAITLQGTLQGLDTRLTVKANPPAQADDDMQGFHTEGTIGGQKYVMDSQFAIDPSSRPAPKPKSATPPKDGSKQAPSKPVVGTMSAQGSVAGQDIKKSYAFAEQDQPFGVTMTLNGSGTVAQAQQDTKVTLTLVA